MIVATNKVVKMHYSVMDNDKNSIDNSFDGEPLIFIVGTGYLIQGLEDALQGKKAGDTLSVTVPPEQGYGERHDDLMQAVPKSMFEGMEIEVGMQFRASTDDGDQSVMIIDIQEEDVIVDGNNPLAGITLNFDVEILEVRDATADELLPQKNLTYEELIDENGRPTKEGNQMAIRVSKNLDQFLELFLDMNKNPQTRFEDFNIETNLAAFEQGFKAIKSKELAKGMIYERSNASGGYTPVRESFFFYPLRVIIRDLALAMAKNTTVNM